MRGKWLWTNYTIISLGLWVALGALGLRGETLPQTTNDIVCGRWLVVFAALALPDVIHSFWIPALSGKMDMLAAATPGNASPVRGNAADWMCAPTISLVPTQGEKSSFPR